MFKSIFVKLWFPVNFSGQLLDIIRKLVKSSGCGRVGYLRSQLAALDELTLNLDQQFQAFSPHAVSLTPH